MKTFHVVILFTVAFYAAGILLFTFGFLLSRIVVARNSSCDFPPPLGLQGDPALAGDGHRWLLTGHGTALPAADDCPSAPKGRYRRAVLVVVDALRFDFVYRNRSGERQQGEERPYENKLTVLTDLLDARPQNARLYRFVADPPTTTMQRLKGLTTGSLPTFIDAGANFASPEITEDNFVDQLRRLGRNITFMGDDTWEGLFPKRFGRSFPFPSFNVKDLDTVDNGVVRNLMQEFRRGDWNLLIAHFLGVDHCGHTYGPNHQMMASKLTQMNNIIGSLIEEMTDDTVLFVLGDHGMTKSGDHGGDSKEEVDAALFVYSPQLITASSPPPLGFKTHSQIDLVPTLCLLLGIPIPFSNLGSVIVDLFDYDSKDLMTRLYRQVSVLHLNARQVYLYTEEYAKHSNDLPYDKLKQLNGVFLKAQERLKNLVEGLESNSPDTALVLDLEELKAAYEGYLLEVKEMCRSVWAQFDLRSMVMGLLVYSTAVFLNIILVMGGIQQFGSSPFVSRLLIWLFCCAVLGILLHVNVLNEIVFCIAVMLAAVIIHRKTTPSELWSLFSRCKLNHLDLFALTVFVTYILSLLSNSFVVYEDVVTSFLLLTLTGFLCLAIIFTSFRKTINADTKHGRHPKLEFSTVMIVLSLLFCISTALRLSQYFRACREEQWTCESSMFLQPLSALVNTSKFSSNVRIFLSVVSVGLIMYSSYWWLRYCGNLNGSAISVVMVSYVIPFSFVMIIFYWFILALVSSAPNVVKMPQGVLNLPPRLVYFISLASLLVVSVRPLCLFVVSRRKDPAEMQELNLPAMDKEALIPQIYNQLKLNYARNSQASKDEGSSNDNAQPPVVVYGLATVYSSSHMVLLLTVTMVIVLLLGDGVAPSVLLMWIMLFAILELDACHTRIVSYRDQSVVPWISTVLMFFLASEHFFSTGHQATIPSIRWEAAFHGLTGDFSTNAIPALLIALNTFASYVFGAVALPLVIFWRFTRGRWALPKVKVDPEERKGELRLSEDQNLLSQKLFSVVVRYILLFGLKLLAMMLCVTIHRRHLMVWKIFAPRFLYELVTFLVISFVSFFVFCFVIRVDRCIDNWIKKIES